MARAGCVVSHIPAAVFNTAARANVELGVANVGHNGVSVGHDGSV